MNELPIHRRKFHTFLSHASADKDIVNNIKYLLSEVCKIPVWYDADYLPAGAHIATELPEAIVQCRSMIIILSKTAIKRGWVKEEYEYGIEQRTRFKDFHILPVRIDNCEVPGFLKNTRWIDIPNGKLSLETITELLLGLYYTDIETCYGNTKDIYISRTWRENEAPLADHISKILDKTGFRLIGDFMDQPNFDEENRIKSIISSCGGLVSILPHRGNGKTSDFMLKEIYIAQKLKIPNIIIAEPEVILSEDISELVIQMKVDDNIENNQELQNEMERLMEEWKTPSIPRYIFYATDFNQQNTKRNLLIKKLIERITSMPCLMGDDIQEGEVQKFITEKISGSFLMIADISAKNINTLIEAGIARGANKKYYLVAKGPRHSPPFMFRDQQVWYYDDDVELIGLIHKLIYPYRRRVLNLELQK